MSLLYLNKINKQSWLAKYISYQTLFYYFSLVLTYTKQAY